MNDNYEQTLARLRGLIRNLITNDKLLEYGEIRKYLYTGCVKNSPQTLNKNKTFYIPHRPVCREDNATTKVRVLYDGSAHMPSFTSLTENAFHGDDLI